MGQSISVIRDGGWYFHFYSNSDRTFCKQTVKTLVRRCVQQRLIWVCPVFICPTKRTLHLYGLMDTEFGIFSSAIRQAMLFLTVEIQCIITPMTSRNVCLKVFQNEGKCKFTANEWQLSCKAAKVYTSNMTAQLPPFFA